MTVWSIAKTKEEILQAKLSIASFLNSIGLAIHEEKSEFTNFERGFRFLGHGFLGKTIFPVDVNEDELKSAIQNLQSGQNNPGNVGKNRIVNGQAYQTVNQQRNRQVNRQGNQPENQSENQQGNIGKKKVQISPKKVITKIPGQKGKRKKI
jgi:hypothetical protein